MAGIGRLARFGFSAPPGRPDPVALLGPKGMNLWDAEHQRPVDEEAALVLDQLRRAADPDLALRQLSRIADRDAGLIEVLGGDPDLRDRLITVLGASEALGDHLAANSGEWQCLRHTMAPRYEVHSGLLDVAALRKGYRRGLVRIAAADLADQRDVEWTMAELTALADATLRTAYRQASARVRSNPRLAVIAMGKCGGIELNYVSDVDVIFVAAEDEDLSDATAIAAGLMEICGQVAWPVDANLRPEGSQGPLVRTLASHLAYYKKWARTWEFQALLKARAVAGEVALGRSWLTALQPLIWHAAERPDAVADVRAMRRRIIDQIPRSEVDREIKRGPGGLRDIEFAVQLLQLVHGRGDDTLRSPSTLTALRSLVSGGYVGRRDGDALVAAYRFLREVEHRLQLQRLRRTHTVPTAAADRHWLAQSLGYAASGGRTAEEAFRTDWVGHAAEVRRLHAKLFYRPLLSAVAQVPADGLSLRAQDARKRLELLGYADPAGALRHIEALTGGVSRTAAIQRTLLPVLLDELADAPDPDAGLLAYRHVSEKLGTTPWYLRLLRDEGPVALRLARLLGTARYAVDLLSRDPEALRLMASDAELSPLDRPPLMDAMASAAGRYKSKPDAIRAVRAVRRRELFRVACADVLSSADEEYRPSTAVDLTEVGEALSDITDATLAAALEVAAVGLPEGFRFTVIGMGRLGGYEMSYPSDADVMFVYDPPPGTPDDRAQGMALTVAEGLRTLLAAPAQDPPLGVDADLRPEGRQGPLVRSLLSYERYYAKWSAVWEAQALLRARPVAGSDSLAEQFIRLVDPVRYPDGGLRREQIVEIRRIKARVESERLPRSADPLTHTKLGRGGIADVEWIVQLWQLRWAYKITGLKTTRTLAALAAAREAGLVSTEDAEVLSAAWRLAARVRNALTLVRGRASDQMPRQGPELEGVARLLGHTGDPALVLENYLRTTRRARTVYERLFA